MIEIINRQRKIKFDREIFQKFSESLAEKIEEIEKKSFTLVFVSDRKIKTLNNDFRGNNSTTDVLSFPFEPDEFEADENQLGDIIISAEQAERQSIENHLTFEREIKQLILHGVLHLCGYDHETDNGEMNARELELRDKLGIS
ncbi:rRNA maturation RNase YbeY [soil metagenome]